MKKFLVLLSFSLIFLFISNTAYAIAPEGNSLLPTAKARLQEEKDYLKEEMKNTLREKKDELLEKIKSEREIIKSEIKIQREDFQDKLDAIKDERKKLILSQIDAKISRLNLNHTDILTNALEKLNNLTGRLEEKINIASGSGQDTAEAVNLLKLAREAIAKAEDALAKQVAKDYTPSLGNDPNAFGSTISAVIREHRNDLQTVREIVRSAKKAVIDLAKSVARLNVHIPPKLSPSQTAPPSSPTANITDIP